jgi:hypothetical protein
MPIYCSALHPGKYHLMVGHPAKVRVYRINTGDEQITANEIIDPLPYYATNHTDLVRSVVCIDGKFCSAG